jgi:hypothetical protein
MKKNLEYGAKNNINGVDNPKEFLECMEGAISELKKQLTDEQRKKLNEDLVAMYVRDIVKHIKIILACVDKELAIPILQHVREYLDFKTLNKRRK